MAEVLVLKIKIIGKGGHGSSPETANDPIQSAVDFHIKLREIIQKYQDQKKNFICTFPVF
jgi:metal-dependent amidase/aminoacylase/carboxypeptidase family protein